MHKLMLSVSFVVFTNCATVYETCRERVNPNEDPSGEQMTQCMQQEQTSRDLAARAILRSLGQGMQQAAHNISKSDSRHTNCNTRIIGQIAYINCSDGSQAVCQIIGNYIYCN